MGTTLSQRPGGGSGGGNGCWGRGARGRAVWPRGIAGAVRPACARPAGPPGCRGRGRCHAALPAAVERRASSSTSRAPRPARRRCLPAACSMRQPSRARAERKRATASPAPAAALAPVPTASSAPPVGSLRRQLPTSLRRRRAPVKSPREIFPGFRLTGRPAPAVGWSREGGTRNSLAPRRRAASQPFSGALDRPRYRMVTFSGVSVFVPPLPSERNPASRKGLLESRRKW